MNFELIGNIDWKAWGIKPKNKSVDSLANIPILEELFKSWEFQERGTTLMVFKTPIIVTPEHPWICKTIGDIQKIYKDYEAETSR